MLSGTLIPAELVGWPRQPFTKCQGCLQTGTAPPLQGPASVHSYQTRMHIGCLLSPSTPDVLAPGGADLTETWPSHLSHSGTLLLASCCSLLQIMQQSLATCPPCNAMSHGRQGLLCTGSGHETYRLWPVARPPRRLVLATALGSMLANRTLDRHQLCSTAGCSSLQAAHLPPALLQALCLSTAGTATGGWSVAGTELAPSRRTGLVAWCSTPTR